MVELSPVQQRVIGALAEKEMATPDNYPLSMNALLAACNQSTNRDPVVTYTEETVDNALANLRASGVARVVYSKGMRVDKYRHVLHETLGLDQAELAVVTVLLLPRTADHGRVTSTHRAAHPFADQAALDATLNGLAAREPALAELLARQPGQKEPRWMHLLGPTAYVWSGEAEPEAAPAPAPAPTDRIAELEARVAAIEARLGGDSPTGHE